MRRLRASDIISLVRPRGRRKLLTVIVYIDESGAHGGPNDALTLGGWIARERRWTRIEDRWDSVLGRRVFHMTDFENYQGAFATWPAKAKRVPLVSALADSLQGNEAFGTAHSVHLEPFQRIMCPPKARLHQVKRFAYGMLLPGCLTDVMTRFGVPADEEVTVICEECDGVEGFATEMVSAMRKRNGWEDRLALPLFRSKDSFRGLQAADMLAYEAFKDFTNQVLIDDDERKPVRKLFEALKARRRLSIAHMTEENIKRWRALYSTLPAWPPKGVG